jgi:photosystem II stability/assembly factor-like uncharacterized protein
MNNRLRKNFLKTITLSLILRSIYFFIQFFFPWFGTLTNLNTMAEARLDFEHKSYIPQAQKNHKYWIDIDRIWTANVFEQERVAYLLGDTIVHYISGSNSTGEIAAADITWTQESPCGQSQDFSDSLELEKGDWAESYFSTLLDCVGIHTHTLHITHNDRTTTQTTQFVVNNPSAAILGDKPAFDICGVPSLYQMQKWWDDSPYWAANIYIGGIHRGCANSNLDAFWVHEVIQQGWQLIPTWVGPQAPCSQFTYRIFSDPELAYIQGKIEADAAYQAADQLGFMGGTNVIYYDLEGYVATSLECRQASASFLQGWTERLHVYGIRAGAYGGACSSYMKDWAANSPLLDNVWIADWKIPFEFDEDASVYGVRCLDQPEILYWTNHQRIRQYAGDHYETWGGVKLGIDSNIADGEVAAIPQGAAPLQNDAASPSKQGTSIQDMQMISPGQGWALVDQRLLWSEDGGLYWSDLTPIIDPAGVVLSAFFTDSGRGWAASRTVESGELAIYRSDDAGQTWKSINLDHSRLGIGDAHLLFVDATTGWLVIKQQTSANFSLGELFRTLDGGETWQQLSLPIGEPVHFTDPQRGWVAGGVEGHELYVTNDGGVTWEARNGSPADSYGYTSEMFSPDATVLAIMATLPEGVVKTDLADAGNAWAHVEKGECSGNKNVGTEVDPGSTDAFECQLQSRLLQTTDGGQNWTDITPSIP